MHFSDAQDMLQHQALRPLLTRILCCHFTFFSHHCQHLLHFQQLIILRKKGDCNRKGMDAVASRHYRAAPDSGPARHLKGLCCNRKSMYSVASRHCRAAPDSRPARHLKGLCCDRKACTLWPIGTAGLHLVQGQRDTKQAEGGGAEAQEGWLGDGHHACHAQGNGHPDEPATDPGSSLKAAAWEMGIPLS